MLFSIITAALAEAPDLVVAGQIGDDEDLSAQVSRTNADAVITQSDTPAAIDHFVPLLHRFPELKVVVIHSASNSGFVHQLRPYSARLPELSADVLQAVLRTPAPPRRPRR